MANGLDALATMLEAQGEIAKALRIIMARQQEFHERVTARLMRLEAAAGLPPVGPGQPFPGEDDQSPP